MADRTTLSRLARLEFLTEQLKQEGYCKVGELASVLGVSVRTVTRDIRVLRDNGLPIDADSGRGGGIRLDRHWGIGRVNLNYAEAVDLLVSLAVAEQMNSPLFLAGLTSIRRKLMASFSPDKRVKVSNLKSRILIGESASTFVLSSFETPTENVVQSLHQAFIAQREIKILYKSDKGIETERVIEPHYLLLNYPVWYVLSWDHLRGNPRTFRCDRIMSVILMESRFKLKPKQIYTEALGANLLL